MSLAKLPLPALALVAGLAACGGQEADPSTVEARLAATLPALVDSTFASTEFLAESPLLTDLGDGLTVLDSAFAALPFTSDSDPLAPVPAADENGEDEPSGAEIAQSLSDTVFTEDAYEGDGVYLLGPDLFCPEDETGTLDAECVDLVIQAELRLRVELAGDGLDVTLLVGPDRDEPVSVELRSDRASVVGDLGEAADAAAFLATLSGEDLELPDVLEGVAAISLVVNGPKDVSFELAVREAIVVEGNLLDVGPVAFSTGVAEPLAALRLDGLEQRLTASVDVARTTFQAPWSSMFADSLATGTFDLDWQGVSASVTLESGAESLVIDDIGFGDGTSTVSLDEFPLIAVDLNADAGRRVALTIAPTDALPSFTFDPELDLSVAVDFSPLADAGDEVPASLLEEIYGLRFDGATPTAQPVESADGLEGALSVVAGTLTISSATEALTVAAGQCLVADALEVGEHPLLGHLAAGACP